MSLEKILKKITDDAQGEVDQIIQESQRRAEQIKDSSRKEVAVQAEAVLKESKRLAGLETSRIVTQARLERKIDVLSCKKELIDTVLEQAFRKAGENWGRLKRVVIDKEGQSEESLDEQMLKTELRPQLEKFIADVLKI